MIDLDGAEEVKAKLVQVLPHSRQQEQAFEKRAKGGRAGRLMHTDKRRVHLEEQRDLEAKAFSTQTERVDAASQLNKVQQELAKQTHCRELIKHQAPQAGLVKDLAMHKPTLWCPRDDPHDAEASGRGAARRGVGDESGCRFRVTRAGREAEALRLPDPEVQGGRRDHAGERECD